MEFHSELSSEVEKEARRQQHRRFLAGLVVVSMLIETGELAVFALAGSIPMYVPVLFLVFGVGLSALVYLFFRFGLNQQLANKNLLIPQLLINAAIQVSFMLFVPQLAFMFLVVLIVLAAYTLVEFTPRQFTISWLIYGVVTGVALWLIRDRFAYPVTNDAGIFAVWLFCFMTMRSLTWPTARFSALRNKLSEKNRQLEESLRKIEVLARHDSLTGVLNHRSVIETLEVEMQRSRRTGQPFCFAMLDLDLFKSINDNYGHPVGDAVLRQVCEIVAPMLRASDAIGRLGGEEFAIIFSCTALEDGLGTMERLRETVANHEWERIAPGLAVSFSAGIAEFSVGDTVQTINKRADDALYAAKHGGRNRVLPAVPDRERTAVV